jgi:hypothetical protein
VLATDWEIVEGTGLGLGFAALLPFQLIGQREWLQAELGKNLAMSSRNACETRKAEMEFATSRLQDKINSMKDAEIRPIGVP